MINCVITLSKWLWNHEPQFLTRLELIQADFAGDDAISTKRNPCALPLETTHDSVTDENMATNKTNVVPTLMSGLSMDVLEKLGMKLNPRHPLKDFRYLAGKMNYTYESVRNFERQKNPTAFLLSEWWMSNAEKGEQKTVTDLIKYLQEMKRDDAVELLRPVEFTGKSYGTSSITL